MKNSSTKRFRYTLEPLLKKRQMDWTWIKVEEASAKTVVDERETELKGIEGVIDEAQEVLRQWYVQGAAIDPHLQQSMSQYLALCHGELEQKRKQLLQASKVYEQVNRNLNAVRQAIKALEKHKDKKRSDFLNEQVRAELNQTDELWLMSSKGNGASTTAAGNVNNTAIKVGGKKDGN